MRGESDPTAVSLTGKKKKRIFKNMPTYFLRVTEDYFVNLV